MVGRVLVRVVVRLDAFGLLGLLASEPRNCCFVITSPRRSRAAVSPYSISSTIRQNSADAKGEPCNVSKPFPGNHRHARAQRIPQLSREDWKSAGGLDAPVAGGGDRGNFAGPNLQDPLQLLRHYERCGILHRWPEP